MATNRVENDKTRAMIPAIAMLRDIPTWCVASQAPTDWALLQQAKKLRNTKEEIKTDSIVETKDIKVDSKDYPLAIAATGLTPSAHKTKSWIMLVLFAVVVVAGLVICMSVNLDVWYHAKPTTSQLYLPGSRQSKPFKKVDTQDLPWMNVGVEFPKTATATVEKTKIESQPIVTNEANDDSSKDDTMGASFSHDNIFARLCRRWKKLQGFWWKVLFARK